MNKQERHEVYKEVLKHLRMDWRAWQGTFGICWYLEELSGFEPEDFPEFMKKVPTKILKKVLRENVTFSHWYSQGTEYGYRQRVRILKQCIKETEP